MQINTDKPYRIFAEVLGQEALSQFESAMQQPFVVRGKGNPDALWSSSHGAGRMLGRKEAKRTLNMESFTETMAGVVALVTDETLDESPFVYKDIFSVMGQQGDMVEVVAHVRPILNIKG